MAVQRNNPGSPAAPPPLPPPPVPLGHQLLVAIVSGLVVAMVMERRRGRRR